ncbi:MAG: ABC transporter ATP-binding protein [Candidatus Omnitrophica bacterium]|nr:ABC transporter ATP-binding protein [Candidatus Omnitrophota bacterium]
MFDPILFFKQFKRFVGNRIYYMLGIVWFSGIVEGIGITLFLPILQNGFGDDTLSRGMQVIFGFLHIGYSFTTLLILILGLFIVRSVFLVAYAWYFGRIIADLTVLLRERILYLIFTADYLYLLKKETGFINNAIVREVALVVQTFRTFSNLAGYLFYVVIYIVLALLVNPFITVVTLLSAPALIFFIKRLNIATSKASIASSLAYGRFNSIMIQVLTKLKYLKSTLAHERIAKVVYDRDRAVGYFDYKLSFLQSLMKNAFEPFVVFIVVALFFYQVVILGKTVNEVIFLVFLFLQIARQFLNAQSSYRKFLSASGSIATFNNLERELEDNKEILHDEGISPDFDREIVLRDATVVFPNGKKGVERVDINIKPRTTVALVGHSGSGKSTIANMITGLVKPNDGQILFGDVPYDKINLKALRKSIGYVTQEDVIFNASIRENITLWETSSDLNKLRQVMAMAHIKDFVDDLPDKEDEILGENGLDISGGQRQRITIARELYKDAKILILDEATSSLDSKSENQVYENLKEYKGLKTMIVIAHRLSTIKNADYVYVLDRGRVVEEGTYEDLQRNRGEFTKMVEAQKLT